MTKCILTKLRDGDSVWYHERHLKHLIWMRHYHDIFAGDSILIGSCGAMLWQNIVECSNKTEMT